MPPISTFNFSSAFKPSLGKFFAVAGIAVALFLAFWVPNSLAGDIKFGNSQATSFSGVARIDNSRFLVIHDTKDVNSAGLGILTVTTREDPEMGEPKHDLSYVPLVLSKAGWKIDPPPIDFESICYIPKSHKTKRKYYKDKETGEDTEVLKEEAESWEYLVGESADYRHDANSRYQAGFIYHLRFSETKKFNKKGGLRKATLKGKILTAYGLPAHKYSADKKKGDQFEGLACAKKGKGKIYVLIGERGGPRELGKTMTPPFKGFLKWAVLDQKARTMSGWSLVKDQVTSTDPAPLADVHSPRADSFWTGSEKPRDIGALTICDGKVWASATQDEGNDGPFRSIIYHVANFSPGQVPPFQLVNDRSGDQEIPGHKVEGLQGTLVAGQCTFVAVTDDENKGGTFLTLP